MTTSLDIVIVNFNSGLLLRACLASIATTDWLEIDLRRVVVVDNASRDRSAADLSLLPAPIEVIHNHHNAGFAIGCNSGARSSTADYLLFLNPDVRLSTGCVRRLFRGIERFRAENVAIAGGQLYTDAGILSRSCARFPTPFTLLSEATGMSRLLRTPKARLEMLDWDHQSTRIVDHVIGALYLVRRDVFQQLGGFDPSFFLYYEDLDFSRRAALAGFRSVYVSRAKAHHTGGGCSNQVPILRYWLAAVSRVRYTFKHCGRLWGLIAAIVSVATFVPVRLCATFEKTWLRRSRITRPHHESSASY